MGALCMAIVGVSLGALATWPPYIDSLALSGGWSCSWASGAQRDALQSQLASSLPEWYFVSDDAEGCDHDSSPRRSLIYLSGDENPMAALKGVATSCTVEEEAAECLVDGSPARFDFDNEHRLVYATVLKHL